MDNIYVAHGLETTPDIMRNGETLLVITFTETEGMAAKEPVDQLENDVSEVSGSSSEEEECNYYDANPVSN